MDEIQTVIPQILMLFCIAAVGWILRRIHVFTNEVIKGVNSITLKAAWPAMILMTTQKDCTEESLQGFLIVFAFTLVLLLVLMVILGWGCAGLFKDRNNQVFTLLAVMPNAGFVGLPIIEALYGSVGMLYLAAFLAAFNFVLWTVGVLLFSDFSLKNLKCMLNPGLIASVIGTLLFLLKIRLPSFALSTVKQLGSLTTPFSMLLLGARLDMIRLPILRELRLWASLVLKMLVIPLAAVAVFHFLKVDPVVQGVTILSFAMPSASAAQLFAEKYDRDVEFSIAGVSATMLVCILTLPLIILVAGI